MSGYIRVHVEIRGEDKAVNRLVNHGQGGVLSRAANDDQLPVVCINTLR